MGCRIVEEDSMNRKSVVLLSGGIDSATTAAMAIHDGYECFAMTFRYGQRHMVEVKAAALLAKHLNITRHLIIDIPVDIFRSALTNPSQPIPQRRHVMNDEIPVTYVPARNMLFLAYAVAFAESNEARHIFIGVNAIDYSGYPDCRPEFIKSFQETANLATKSGISGDAFIIDTPLLSMRKSDIIRRGAELGVDFSLTTSCYDPLPDMTACGVCDSCLIRKQGFLEAGIPDPIRYRNRS